MQRSMRGPARPNEASGGPSRRRFLQTGVLGGAAAGVLAACGTPLAADIAGSRDNASGVTYWNLFTGGDGANMQSMESAYQHAHPDTHLESTTLAWGDPYYTKLALATAGGQPPDVAIAHITRMPLLAQAGLLTDLRTVGLDEFGITADNFTPAAWQKAHDGDALYAIPLDTHPFVLYYQTEVAQKLGLTDADGVLKPLNGKDTFVSALTEMKKATGQWGGVVTIINDPSTNWRYFYTLLLQAGGTLLDDDGTKVTLDPTLVGDTFELMRTFTGGDKLFPAAIDPTGTVSVFSSGQSGVLLDGEWQVPTYEGAGTKFGVVPVPTIGGDHAASYADSHTLVIPKSSKRTVTQTRRTVQFIRSLLDNSLTWAQGGHIPAWLPVQQSKSFKALKPQANYVQAAYTAHYDPVAWYTGAGSNFQTTVGSTVSALQSGQLSTSSAVSQLRSELAALAKTRPPVD